MASAAARAAVGGSWTAGAGAGARSRLGGHAESPRGKGPARTPNPQDKALFSAAGASPSRFGRRGPRAAGAASHGPRPPAPGGGAGRGTRLRSLSGVQALADSALSRPERKAAVTVTR